MIGALRRFIIEPALASLRERVGSAGVDRERLLERARTAHREHRYDAAYRAPNNLARTMQYIPLLAGVEQGIVGCFHTGGGLSYDQFPRFHALMAEDSAAVFDAALVDVILPLVEGLPDRLRDGIHVADIGCGSGHAVNVLAQAYPASRLVGYDFSTEAIQAARVEADKRGLTNARFEVIDVATLDQPDSFDLVAAFDAIHDQAHPAQVLAAVARALRPRRRLPDGRHQGFQRPRGQPRAALGAVPLHGFHPALLDRVAGSGRGRAGGRSRGNADMCWQRL
jgi:SAM-dependent methyltransferase